MITRCGGIITLASAGLLTAITPGQTFAAGSTTQQAPSVATQPAPAQVARGLTGDWFGYRTILSNAGLTVGGVTDYDLSKVFSGGINTGASASREITNLSLSLTSEQRLGWHGGTFALNFQNHEGANGTGKLVNDAQGFDNQDGPHAAQLSQAWFQQTWADDTLRIKIGRVDANSEFAYVSYGTQFLNSSFGFSPAIFALPTYPDPALSANLFWTPNDHFYLGGGIYDSNNTDRSLIFAGQPNAVRPNSGGVFSIVEVGQKWAITPQNLPGRFGFGGYYHGGRFPRFDGSLQAGAGGVYAVLDQAVWIPPGSDENSSRGIGVFLQGAVADADVSMIDQQAGTGVAWTGPIPMASRGADVLGIAATYAHFSHHAGLVEDYEVAIEAFYKIQITPWFGIQPDLQYILNPGGDGARDALVATIRVEIDF